MESSRLAKLLVQYIKKCPNTEFPRHWIERAHNIAQGVSIPQLHTIAMNGKPVLAQSSLASVEVMMDISFNKWTRDAGAAAWTDEHGGKTFDSPKYITIKTLQTLDGRTWQFHAGCYWTNSRGEMRRFRPTLSSEEWQEEYLRAWESNDGDLTVEWPSKRRLPFAMPAGAESRIDRFFHFWTRAASGEWVDEYGGWTADSHDSKLEMHTADGKAWLWRTEHLWVSRRGECQRQQPPAWSVAAGEWREELVRAWTSSDGDLCLGWPSKVLQERQRGAAAK